MVVKNIVNQSPSSSVLSKVVFFVSFFIFTPSIAYLYYTDYNITKNINELEKQDKESGRALQDVIAIASSHSNDIKEIDRQLTGAAILISEQDAKLKTQNNDLKSLNNELCSLRDQMDSLVRTDQHNSDISLLGVRMSNLDSEIKNINDKINSLPQVNSISENINDIGDSSLISDKNTQLQDIKENKNTYLKDDFKVNGTSSKNTEQMNTTYSSTISADPDCSPNGGMNNKLSSVDNEEIELQSNTEILYTIQELNGRVDVLSKDVSDIKSKVKTYDENYGKFKKDLNTLNGRIDNMQKDISELAMSTSSPNYNWSIGCCNNSSFHLRRSASNKRAWFSFPFFKELIFVFCPYNTEANNTEAKSDSHDEVNLMNNRQQNNESGYMYNMRGNQRKNSFLSNNSNTNNFPNQNNEDYMTKEHDNDNKINLELINQNLNNDQKNLTQLLAANNVRYALSWYFKLIELNVMNNSFLGVRVSLLSPILPFAFIYWEKQFIANKDWIVVNVNFNLFSYIGVDIYWKIDEWVGKVPMLGDLYTSVRDTVKENTKDQLSCIVKEGNSSLCISLCLV